MRRLPDKPEHVILIAFCLNGRVLEFGEPRRQVFNAVERGMLHDFALVFLHAECTHVAASDGAHALCSAANRIQSSTGRKHDRIWG